MSLMDLNLLPSGAKFQAAKVKLQKKVRKILIWTVSVWLAAAAIIFGLNLVAKLRITAAQTQLKKAQDAYMAMADNIITSQNLKYRAKVVGGVLNSRFEYGKAFEEVGKLFPPEVEMTDFKLKDDGGFVLTAQTSGGMNMDMVEKIIGGINDGQNTEFKSAKLATLIFDKNLWKFTVEVTLK
jgi:hypothetical protein